jgi:hypothetical protein
MTATFQTHSTSIRRGANGASILRRDGTADFSEQKWSTIMSSKGGLAVIASEGDLCGRRFDQTLPVAGPGHLAVLYDEMDAVGKSPPALHLVEVGLLPHLPAQVVDVDRVCDGGDENGGLEIVGLGNVCLH